eukprot:13837920-Alexandrium_andersonii.AAC.1
MSASLVGSEMCIRDRSLRVSGNLWESLGVSGNLWEFLGVPGSFWESLSCLLYTSDAADDM